ncbi:P-loop containing nucleoside triphosphate hydrolase protein [Scenedesmus sp. NREL 46B-D3]|nr:P-loop containing nucleoside triphosphate hydrolase protein [Scenedesmus sp. NREL 46B-D3]
MDRAQVADASFQVNTVQWYPGHIAKAERQLKEQLKMVDVVLEVRDARIPQSTCHPQVPLWIGSKPRLVVINRQDMIAKADRAAWDKHFTSTAVFWTDGKTGSGVHSLRRAALKLSDYINAKRAKRGLAPRPVRACVIGFPNIGKSALINRLLGRRVVESAARPGVTRVLRWVRLGGELDLLDAPGIIPAAFNDQTAAQALAMCNDIGEASYVNSLIAAAMIIRIKSLPRNRPILARLQQRYRVDPLGMSAEDFVVHVAGELFGGDPEKAGLRLLGDYRNGALGEFALELPGQH